MRLMRRALIVSGAWTAVALLFAIQMNFQTSSGTDPRPWRWILAWQLSGWWSWAVFTAPVCAFAAWAVRIRRPAMLIAAHVPMALITAVACAGFEGGVKWLFGLYRTPHTLGTGRRCGSDVLDVQSAGLCDGRRAVPRLARRPSRDAARAGTP